MRQRARDWGRAIWLWIKWQLRGVDSDEWDAYGRQKGWWD